MLIITNYWYPWNTSGTFRWLHLSEYLDLDILTSKKPNQGFEDETLPRGRCNRLFRCGRNLPAILSGLYLAIRSVFIRADKYVYTIPPESLLVGAYINQLLGRQVYVDVRDKIDRHTQPHKWLIPVYQWLYKRIKNVCVCMRFFDSEKPVIRHGYDEFKRPCKIIDSVCSYALYHELLLMGYGRYYYQPKFKDYNSSSVVNIRYLDNKILGKENLHPECFEFEPEPWAKIANQMKDFFE